MEGLVKVNVTSGGEERGVFDLTNRDTKTLELGPVAASRPAGRQTCHCTVPPANSRGAFPAAGPLAPASTDPPAQAQNNLGFHREEEKKPTAKKTL